MANALAWVGQSAISYIVQQDFESVGTPSGWSSSGTVTFHNTTTPLEGTGDLKIVASGHADYTFSPAITEAWMVFLLKFINLPSSSSTAFAIFYNPAFLVSSQMTVSSAGVINCFYDSGLAGTMAGTVSAGTLYYCKLHYKEGTGADGIASYELSTSGTFINSGSLFVSTTTGSLVRTINFLEFNYDVDGEYRVDHVRVAATDLGNNFSNWP